MSAVRFEWDPDKASRNKWEYRRGSTDHLADALQYAYNLTFHHSHDFKIDDRVEPGTPEYYSRKEARMEELAIKQAAEKEQDAADIFSLLQM